MKLFIIWDAKGNVATTEINPLESATKASDVSLHILYSAIAIYSVADQKWLKTQAGQNTNIFTQLSLYGYRNVAPDFSTLPKCDARRIDNKIVGLENPQGFYVGPALPKKTVKPTPEVQAAVDAKDRSLR